MDEGPAFGRRHGWTLRRRLDAPDSYGPLFLLIVAEIVATAWSESKIGAVAATVLQAVAVLFALRTSRAGRTVQRVAAVIAVIAVVASILATGTGTDRALAIGSGLQLLLTGATLALPGALLGVATRHVAECLFIQCQTSGPFGDSSDRDMDMRVRRAQFR